MITIESRIDLDNDGSVNQICSSTERKDNIEISGEWMINDIDLGIVFIRGQIMSAPS